MSRRGWEGLGLVSLAVIVAVIPLSLLRDRDGSVSSHAAASPNFSGTASCIECHRDQFIDWLGSDHDLAMDVAADSTVLGDFDDAEYTVRDITSRFYRRDGKFYVWTEGPGGAMAEFEITHVFGHDPLQQYLTPFPGGRLQALHLAWDQVSNRWFHLYPDTDIPPDDWLHWTRNGQNWNGMCAECHSTNLKKGYDPETDTYDTTWDDIDVGCEACHGPGSDHLAWAELPPMARPEIANTGFPVATADLEGPRVVEACAPCHSRRAELGDYDHSGGDLLDHMLPSLLREGLYEPDGQIQDEVYVYGSFLQSKMHANEVRCSDCHGSHSLKLVKDGNDLCLQCHDGNVYDSYDHHFHQKVYEGQPSDGALCVKCHMVERPFMVIDWRADHSFRVPRPDLTQTLGTRDACFDCHDDKPLQWSIDAFTKWYGTARKPHYGTVFDAARAGSTTVAPELVRLADSPLQPAMVRATALEYLSAFPAPEASRSLEAALMSDEALLRQTAASRLFEPDPARRLELLGPLLDDPLKAVRMAATSQLAGTDTTLMKPYQRAALDRGIAEYTAAMEYSLDFASSGLNLGNISQQMGDPVAAEAWYRQSLTVDDLFLPTKMNLAILLSGQGRPDEAEQLLWQAAAEYPEDPNPASSLGLLLVETGRPDEAVTWLTKAVDLDPAAVRIRYNLGLLLQQMGRLDEAEAVFRDALRVAPDDLSVMYALADHLIKRGRTDEAMALAERMIAVHPDQQVGHDIKAYLQQNEQ